LCNLRINEPAYIIASLRINEPAYIIASDIYVSWERRIWHPQDFESYFIYISRSNDDLLYDQAKIMKFYAFLTSRAWHSAAIVRPTKERRKRRKPKKRAIPVLQSRIQSVEEDKDATIWGCRKDAGRILRQAV